MGGQHAAVKARLAPSVTNLFEAAVGGCLFTWPDSKSNLELQQGGHQRLAKGWPENVGEDLTKPTSL